MQRPAHSHRNEEFPIDHFCLQGREAYSESGTMVSGTLSGSRAPAADGGGLSNGGTPATATGRTEEPAQVTVPSHSP